MAFCAPYDNRRFVRSIGTFGIAIVSENATGVLQRFGKFEEVLMPGLHFYNPLTQSVDEISNRTFQERFRLTGMTKDMSLVEIEVAVQYCIRHEDSRNALFSMENPIESMKSFVEDVIRSHIPSHELGELYAQREELGQAISTTIVDRMRGYGFTITSTQVLDIKPDARVEEAMNAVVSSARLLQAAENEGEAAKIKAIKAAQADCERRRQIGMGIAKQRTEIMKGYEAGVDGMSRHLGVTPGAVLDFLLKSQWIDAQETAARGTNAKTVFLGGAPDSFMKAREVETETVSIQ